MEIKPGQQVRLKYSVESNFGQGEIVTFSGWTMNGMYEFITHDGHRTFSSMSNVEILEAVPLIDWDAIKTEYCCEVVGYNDSDEDRFNWFKEQVSKYIK